MTELVQHQPQNALTEQMDYARAVSAGSLLPREYQGNPANVLIAMGLGQSMGLSPAESLYRITVIQGKPTASAELIAANVRKAGHRLRVQSTDTTCTATIIRNDDPDFEFTVTRDFAWAQSMGLASKDNYKKQPGTMLQWRAITAVARLACPEALYGVVYTPDEVERDAPAAGVKSPGVAGLRAAVQQSGAPTGDLEQMQTNEAEDIEDAEVVTDSPAAEGVDPRLTRRMFAAFRDAGFTDDARSETGRARRLDYIGKVIGRPVESSKELTGPEVAQVADALTADAQDAQWSEAGQS